MFAILFDFLSRTFPSKRYLQEQKVALGGATFDHSVAEPMVCYNKTEYVGSLPELKTFANATYQIKDLQNSDDFKVFSSLIC